jgi:hypothetical protein
MAVLITYNSLIKDTLCYNMYAILITAIQDTVTRGSTFYKD